MTTRKKSTSVEKLRAEKSKLNKAISEKAKKAKEAKAAEKLKREIQVLKGKLGGTTKRKKR